MKQINYKTTLKIAAVVRIMFFFTAVTMFIGSSYAVGQVHTDKEKKSKDDKSSLFLDEPRKLTKAEIKENEELTQKLFAIPHVVKVEMPDMTGLEMDTAGSIIISKEVILSNYLRKESLKNKVIQPEVSTEVTNHPKTAEDKTEDANTEGSEGDLAADDEIVYEGNPMINLSEILNTTTVTFIPERNREINTGFFLKVPKDMLSPSWSITLTPKLLLNDSVIALKNVVLKGRDFVEKQKLSYKDYEDYLASIIGKNKYDEHFLDHEGIRKDLRTLQNVYYDKYHQEWSNQVAYDTWRTKTLDTKTREFARKVGQRNDLYYKAQREILNESMTRLAAGKDTSGVYARHMATFEKKAKHLPAKFVKPEIHENEVPKEFKEIFLHSRTVNDLTNGFMTEDDSIKISKHHYMFDKIAENELKDSIKEQREQLIIPFPYQREALVDTVMNGDQDFFFYYPNVSRIVEGATLYRLVIDSKVEAFPHNTFRFPQEDTMTYAISSLADLIDNKLEVKETTLTRVLNSRSVMELKFESNKPDFKTNFKDNKAQVQKFIDTYKTYIENSGLVIDSVLVGVATTLDGYFMHNYALSEKRGNSLRKYAETTFPELDGRDLFRVYPVKENWQGLVNLIRRRSDMPNKDEILNIISNMTHPDVTKNEIKSKFKKDFKIMKDSIYPQLAKSEIQFIMHRPDMAESEETKIEFIEQPGYDKGLKLMRERKYWDALQILVQYPDYNTVLCLASLGHNDKAYDVVTRLKPNADVDYIRAILEYRLGNEEEAIQYLQSACDADPSKAERTSRDPEMALLIRKHNL